MNMTTGGTATASLRVVQGNADAQTVNVLVNGMMTSSNVTYLSVTGYMPVPSGMDMLDIQVAPPQVSPVQNVGLNLAQGTHNTFIMDGCCAFNHSSIQLMDDTAPPASGSAKLRVVDAFLSPAGIDFFVLPAGSTPSGTPTVTGQAFNSASSYLTLTPGAYDVFVTQTPPPGGPIGPVLFHTGSFTLAAGQNRTVAILNLCSPGSCDTSGHTLTSVMLADLN